MLTARVSGQAQLQLLQLLCIKPLCTGTFAVSFLQGYLGLHQSPGHTLACKDAHLLSVLLVLQQNSRAER